MTRNGWVVHARGHLHRGVRCRNRRFRLIERGPWAVGLQRTRHGQRLGRGFDAVRTRSKFKLRLKRYSEEPKTAALLPVHIGFLCGLTSSSLNSAPSDIQNARHLNQSTTLWLLELLGLSAICMYIQTIQTRLVDSEVGGSVFTRVSTWTGADYEPVLGNRSHWTLFWALVHSMIPTLPGAATLFDFFAWTSPFVQTFTSVLKGLTNYSPPDCHDVEQLGLNLEES